jgi:cellulose synthase/poly-beta-1,6-N-acetylglucosamine synthase-like glycosyltransferase
VRPAVDVVVPVAGSAAAVEEVLERSGRLALRDGDTLTVVDNRSVGVRGTLVAAAVRGSYFARNAGASRGAAPWLLFLDADVEAPADLLDRLFAPEPGERTAVLAGGVRDAEALRGAARYAWLRSAMDQRAVLARGFAQTANCAVRRAAFEAVGGFRADVRSGGDADLCWRLAAAGWGLEERRDAAVVHRNRESVVAMLRQLARHGAGAAWLEREHPGSMPGRSWPGVAWWSARRAGAGLAALARGDRDGALRGLLDGPALIAFEFGRLLPNRAR